MRVPLVLQKHYISFDVSQCLRAFIVPICLLAVSILVISRYYFSLFSRSVKQIITSHFSLLCVLLIGACVLAISLLLSSDAIEILHRPLECGEASCTTERLEELSGNTGQHASSSTESFMAHNLYRDFATRLSSPLRSLPDYVFNCSMWAAILLRAIIPVLAAIGVICAYRLVCFFSI